MGFRFAPLAAGLLVAASAPRGPEAPLYVEQDGIVVMEVESHPPVKGWERETEHPGFTGSCYLKANGGSMMTFPIFIMRPGRYTMQIHNRHDHPRRDLENDAFVRMDSGQFIKCFSGPNNTWTWSSTLEYSDRKVKPEYDLSAGLHKLQIRGRSSGFKIDRIALFLSEGSQGQKAMVLGHPETRGAPPMPALDKIPAAASAWSSGRLGTALKRLDKAVSGKDAEAAEQARAALNALNQFIDARRTALVATKEIDPLAAAEGMAFFAARLLRGSEAGKQFSAEARKWMGEPRAKDEMKARRYLKVIEDQAARIRREGKADDPAFAKAFARPLAGIRQTLQMLRKSYPDTWSCRRAEEIAARYGIAKS